MLNPVNVKSFKSVVLTNIGYERERRIVEGIYIQIVMTSGNL